jgi:hypothetical protein
MKITTREWLLAAAATTALLGCGSRAPQEGIAPEDTVVPLDGNGSSPSSDDISEPDQAILDTYGIGSEDFGKA